MFIAADRAIIRCLIRFRSQESRIENHPRLPPAKYTPVSSGGLEHALLMHVSGDKGVRRNVNRSSGVHFLYDTTPVTIACGISWITGSLSFLSRIYDSW